MATNLDFQLLSFEMLRLAGSRALVCATARGRSRRVRLRLVAPVHDVAHEHVAATYTFVLQHPFLMTHTRFC